MPSAIAALSGETKTLALCWSTFTVRKMSNANALFAEITPVSEGERSRGSEVIGAPAAVGSLHADATTHTASEIEQSNFMEPPRWDSKRYRFPLAEWTANRGTTKGLSVPPDASCPRFSLSQQSAMHLVLNPRSNEVQSRHCL